MTRQNSEDRILQEIRIIQDDVKCLFELRGEMKNIRGSLERIETQTTRTNGRVDTHDALLNQYNGALKIMYIVIVLIAIPALIAFFRGN